MPLDQALPSGLQIEIEGAEPLARFLTQSSHFNSKGIKPGAFLPAPDRTTSVYRHDEAPADSLWAISSEQILDRKVYGAGIVLAQIISTADLKVNSDEPPNRHAVIVGWPWIDNNPELQKAQQKNIALIVASQAKLVLAP